MSESLNQSVMFSRFYILNIKLLVFILLIVDDDHDDTDGKRVMMTMMVRDVPLF